MTPPSGYSRRHLQGQTEQFGPQRAGCTTFKTESPSVPNPKSSASRASDTLLRGAALICLAVFAFVIMNGLVRYLGRAGYPVPEIIWARFAFHLILIMAFFPRRIPTLLVSTRKGMQILRSALMLGATVCMYFAVRVMPLADAVAIGFITPLLVVGLSVVILKERVGIRRWSAVFAGLVGMFIIIRPGAGALQWSALLPVAMAVFYAFYLIVTRLIRESADPLNALFYTALVGALAVSLVVPFHWRTPTPFDGLLMAGTGLFGAIGHYAVIKAYEIVEASAVAPFAYSELIWATLVGFLAFGDFPDAWTFAGAAVIIGAGLYVLHRERRAQDAAALT